MIKPYRKVSLFYKAFENSSKEVYETAFFLLRQQKTLTVVNVEEDYEFLINGVDLLLFNKKEPEPYGVFVLFYNNDKRIPQTHFFLETWLSLEERVKGRVELSKASIVAFPTSDKKGILWSFDFYNLYPLREWFLKNYARYKSLTVFKEGASIEGRLVLKEDVEEFRVFREKGAIK